MKVKTTDYLVCAECSDIILYGYSDNIEDAKDHAERCNYIDKKLLPRGEYWLGYHEIDQDQFCEKCEVCGIDGANHTVRSAKNV